MIQESPTEETYLLAVHVLAAIEHKATNFELWIEWQLELGGRELKFAQFCLQQRQTRLKVAM